MFGESEYGVGSLQKELSVHPKVAFRALRAEEVTITDRESLFSPHPSPGLCPQPWAVSPASFCLLAIINSPHTPASPHFQLWDIAETSSCLNNGGNSHLLKVLF